MTVSEMSKRLKKLHVDQQGRAMIEIILILGAIALPLLIILIAFGDKIIGWISSFWSSAEADSKSLKGKKI